MISKNKWQTYIQKLATIDAKAAGMIREYIDTNGLENSQELIEYAYGIVTKYGEASAELSCEMYDLMAESQGAVVPPAEPADTATIDEVARGVQWGKYHSPNQIPSIVGRQTRQAGADTMIKNAIRDQVEWAWIPSGDTCAFCITLASRGWQRASKKVLKGDHAEHIHANCDCTFGIAFNQKGKQEYDYIYDPQKYEDMYYGADGSSPKQRINSIRRARYQLNKDYINAQKRDAYQARAFGKSLENAVDKKLSHNSLIGFFEDEYAETHYIDIRDVPEKSIEEIKSMANEMLNIANQYSQSKSTWTGRITYSKEGAGFNPKTHDIETDGHMNNHMVLHEILHSKSVGNYTFEQYIDHLYEEELPVQMLTQEISRRIGLVEVNGGYEKAINRLRDINKDYGLFNSDYDFAVALFNTDLMDREAFLQQLMLKSALEKAMSEQELAIALERIEGAFHDIIL